MDRKFHRAPPRINRDTVTISSPEAPNPVAVRYAWDANPQACLYNTRPARRPVLRSDWPSVTDGHK